jgi:hypothetical protein
VATALTSPIVAALERAWAGIARHHPDVPARVAFALGSGTAGRSGVWLKGHYAAGRWRHRDSTEVAHEVFVSGELLGHEARDVMATLLHEAAHAIAYERKVQDTSRGGRYHNARYRALATELGLIVDQAGAIGWSKTSLPDETAARYRRELSALAKALTASREPEAGGRHGRTNNNNNGVALTCGGRRIRASLSVASMGSIRCGFCSTDFVAASA